MELRGLFLGLGAASLLACGYSGPTDNSKTTIAVGATDLATPASIDPIYGTSVSIQGATFPNGTCTVYADSFGLRLNGATGPNSFLYGGLVAGANSTLYFRTPLAPPFTYYVVGTYQEPSPGPLTQGTAAGYTLNPGIALVGTADGGSLGGQAQLCYLYMTADTLPSPVASPAL